MDAAYKNIKHGRFMMNQMYEYWKDEKYCDVILKVGQHTLKSHKVVLAACFEYFRGLFDMGNGSVNLHTSASGSDNKMESSGLETHVLKYVDYTSFCQLIEYAYTGQISITTENVQNLVMSADYFGENEIKRECEDFMLRNIDMENHKELIVFADKYSLQNLEACAFKFIGQNFETLLEKGELLSMPLDSFMKLYKTRDLLLMHKKVLLHPKMQEQCLFRAAMAYCLNCPEKERESILSELLKNVRLPLLGPETLKDESKPWGSVLSLPSIKYLIDLSNQISQCGLPVSSNNEDIPIVWKSSRILSRQQIVHGTSRLASGNQAGYPTKLIEEAKEIDIGDRIQRITIWIRYWDGVEVLSGIKVRYKSGREIKCGGRVEDQYIFVRENVVELEEDEVITKVSGRYGWLIDCIEFHTNLDRTFGPFGGTGGRPFSEIPGSDQLASYLNDVDDDFYDDEDEVYFGHDVSVDSRDTSDGSENAMELTTKSKPAENTSNVTDETVIYRFLHGIVAGEIVTQSHIAITHLGFSWLEFKT